ncbi:MAG TPA: VOC family protein [Povalibacter sp.]
MRLSTHLCFDGTCEAAFGFYQHVLGGSIKTMLRYGDSALAEQTPAHLRSRIIHATLDLGMNELLGADLMPDQHRPAAGFFVTLSVADAQRARDIFTALSEGGEIRMPFAATFWSPGFGVLVDRFGTPWEINCETASGPG